MSIQAKIFFAALILHLSFCPVYGQNESDINAFQSFFREKNELSVEKTLAAANSRWQEATGIQDAPAEAKALKDLGLLHLTRTHDYEKAMDFFLQALAIEDSLQMKEQQILTYIGIARVFEVVGDYYKSAQFLRQALTINESHQNVDMLALILNNLGKVNASMGKADEALGNYELVLEYENEIDPQVKAEALFNLGQLYTLEGKYPEALRSYKKALTITRAIRDKPAEALTLNDIGEVYRRMKNDDKSMANHLVALEIRGQLHDKRGMAQSYNNIGYLYGKQDSTGKAIENILLALENARESQAQEQIFKSYELLSQVYKDIADFEKALTYKELSLAISDFMQNERYERQLLETQNRYIIGKRESQIEKLERQRETHEKAYEDQQKSKNILILLVALCIIIFVLTFFLYLLKRRSNARLRTANDKVQQQNIKLQELNSTKDKFFSILSHDLKGPLNSLTSFSHLLIAHTDSMSKEDIQMLARDLDKSVRNLFALLENLLEWSRSQTGNIDFTPEAFDLMEALETNKTLLESQANNKHISIVIDHHAPCQVKLHKHSIHTVVRNLISNAIKFTHEGGVITLTIARSPKAITLFVKDTGVGMTQDVIDKLFRLDKKYSTQGTGKESGTGLGLILCKDFIEKNGGNIRVKSEPGTGSVFIFSFPSTIILETSPEIAAPAPVSSAV